MVLSRAHMSMVIFPHIFNIFYMSGVKKNVKNQKKIRATPSMGVCWSASVGKEHLMVNVMKALDHFKDGLNPVFGPEAYPDQGPKNCPSLPVP